MHRLPLVMLALGSLASWSLADGKKQEQDEKPTQGLWAYTSPKRPTLPAIASGHPANNPIDHFILARLQSEGIKPNAQADKLTLLRRITYDLTGLPPTRSEQESFLSDESPMAYDRVVDRLMASPRYGERWAQHWLDVVRYAETDGFKSDDHRPSAHLYRDYVISALNEDLPYSRFVQQQLAGDELEPSNSKALVATGFNRLMPDEYNAANLEQRHQEILDDLTEVTGSAFLGLTVGCARCHNHKFDPILQKDYFALQAYFAAMRSDDATYSASPEKLARYQAELANWENKTEQIRSEMRQLTEKTEAQQREYLAGKFRQEIQDAIFTPEAKRTPYQHMIALIAEPQLGKNSKDTLKKLSPEQKKKYEELEKRLQEVGIPKPTEPQRIMAVRDLGQNRVPPTHLLAGGDWRKPKKELQPEYPEFLKPAVGDVGVLPKGDSTGRRSALANWLTQKNHPLTARVMMNRLWQHHFGVGIVATSNDFGNQGEPATHPELLDWLAVEFTGRDWSLKHMHRLMVTSSTYKQSSLVDATNPDQLKAMRYDKENKFFWRANRRRLEGEAIRDTFLALGRDLSSRMYGASAKPKLPDKLSTGSWKPDAAARDQNRRSVYVLAKRNVRYPLFEAFDQPDLHNSCGRRCTTLSAPQALLLLNSDITLGAAKHWCDNLFAATSTPGGFVRAAIREAWGREPTAAESKQCIDFMARQAELLAESGVPDGDASKWSRLAAEDFCHALLNTNEFLYID